MNVICQIFLKIFCKIGISNDKWMKYALNNCLQASFLKLVSSKIHSAHKQQLLPSIKSISFKIVTWLNVL